MLEKQDIQANIPNLIERIYANYEARREPAIVEPIQNSQDAYADAMSEGRITDGRDLHITFRINAFDNSATITDNAGGMTRQDLEEVIPEIDTTSESKQGGGSVGSMGRGLIAVAAATEKTYIETLNTDGERLATIIYPNSGEITSPVHPRDIANDDDEDVVRGAPKIEAEAGTLLKLSGIDDSVMETLTDWDEIESILAEIFLPLFDRDDIKFTYVIETQDGVESHQPDIPSLDDLVEEVVHTKEEHTFHAKGKDYKITDITYGRAADQYPWEGIAMFKGRDYFDQAIMRVDHYKPYIPSLRGDNPDMIAYCRIDDCAELEDPSHQKLQIDNRDTDLKEPTQQVHAEYFAEESASEEQEINRLLQDTVNEAVSALGDNYVQEFVDFDRQGVLDTEVETSSGSGEDTDNSLLNLNAEEYPYDVGDIELQAKIYPPENPDVEKYVIYDIEFDHQDSDYVVEVDDEFDIEAVPDEIQRQMIAATLEKEGWYWAKAKIAKVPVDVDDRDHWRRMERQPTDSSQMLIPVGVEPTGSSGEETTGGGGDGPDSTTDENEGESETSDSGSIISNLNEPTDPSDPVFARADLRPDQSGFTVHLNKGHEKWRDILRSSNRVEEQKERLQEFGSKKIARAIVEEMKLVQIREATTDIDDAERMRERLYEIRDDHEEIYARLEGNVEEIVTA